MGCWSESCGVSGVEIPMNNKVYALTMEQSYDGYQVSVPPVLGTYDDYGGIDLLEDLPEFGFKKGENWRPVEDKRGLHMFVDAAVFDNLGTLEPEFTYGDRPKTISGVWLEHRKELVALLEKWIAIRESTKDEKDKTFDRLMSRGERVFGYSDGFMKDAAEVFQEAVDAGGTIESMTPLIDTYGRAVVLHRAFSELRKKPAPGSVTGPQHGGEQALIPFYNFVLNLARKRREENRDDMWNLEEMDKDYPLDSWKAEVSGGITQLGFRDWQVEQEHKSYEKE